MNIAIVVIGYNRAHSIERLLNSLNEANYANDKVELIISIDNSGSDEVESVAKNFNWKNGRKKIKTYGKRLGLRNHILNCGDLTEVYENIIVLEDDLYVSKNFYIYAKQALNYYKDNNNLAGISLYSHRWNVNVNRPFEAADDMYDTYFLQYAQSWGQVWNKKWWGKFREWYDINCDKNLKELKIPNVVANWPSTSWLKYHIAYLFCENKYFVYPRVSLTTNFTEVGQHAQVVNSDYQVSLQLSEGKKYIFPKFEDGIKYDVYFERLPEEIFVNKYNSNDICIDLYGEKDNYDNKRYLLTTKKKDFKILNKYALRLRPHENNIFFNIKGNQIYLYDTSIKFRNNSNLNERLLEISYDVKSTSRKKMMYLFAYYLKNKLKNIFRK